MNWASQLALKLFAGTAARLLGHALTFADMWAVTAAQKLPESLGAVYDAQGAASKEGQTEVALMQYIGTKEKLSPSTVNALTEALKKQAPVIPIKRAIPI